MTVNNYVCDNGSERLDAYIVSVESSISRSRAKKMIDDGLVTVNDKIQKAGYTMRYGDAVQVTIEPPKEIDLTPENMPIDIVYQDEYLAVINKPQGLTVHPSTTQADHTLVNAIMYHIDNLSGINGEIRAGIVHRLDKNTSGLIVIAKCDEAHRNLAKQIEEKSCKRDYIALVEGNIKQDSGTIDAPLARSRTDRKKMAVVVGGRRAVTDYKIKERCGKYSLVEFSLKTGRTHQIRVHSKHIGHPIVGDDVYNGAKCSFSLNGQLLHAFHLSFVHPVTSQKMDFYAPLPDYFQKIIDKLFNNAK